MKSLVVVATIICLTASGCSLPFQLAADLAGNMAASSLKSPNLSQPELIIGQEMEKHQIGKYVVEVSDGFFKENPCIILVAYNQGRHIKSVYFEKKNPDDMKMINNFNQMGGTAKKRQIREWFLKYSKLDLGPIEPETAEKSPTTPSAPSINVPLPAFTPRRL